MVLARFFKDDELKEMVDLLKTFTRHPEVERIIEKYGEGFDTIYFNGNADAKLQIARNFLKKGVDVELISECTGISIEKIKNLKREL